EYTADGAVPGNVLNQFSMDEYDDHFRIATTAGRVSRSGGDTSNNVYVLNSSLNIVGRLEDLAPGERIHSARFMGGRCYLVTFKKVDPLFTIDLNDPENPFVLGKLKIPGYSDYLHPYDEDHLIGIGKETVEAEEGDFAWYQGVKISLFDVSDVENPRELSKLEIGDRGTDTPALYDHKAVLFSRSRNLLVIPILVAEIDESDYADDVLANAYGEYVYQGAHVFHVSPEEGIRLRGVVSHIEGDEAFLKSGYYFDSELMVERSLYIDDVLYTLSSGMVKMNWLDDLAEVGSVELP
ncbi:MAG TPA: beta-propeller domain-containing protein, partial [Patescibacteria group bacterium]|nr:beta-propeller domain-containing protein [Patescibacteria group bacterium]